MLALVVVHHQPAQNLASADDRNEGAAQRAVRAQYRLPGDRFLRCRVGDDGLARLKQALGGTTGEDGHRGAVGQPAAMFDRIDHSHGSRGAVEPADADVAQPGGPAQLVADEFDDGVEIELRGHALLDAVDGGQLGR